MPSQTIAPSTSTQTHSKDKAPEQATEVLTLRLVPKRKKKKKSVKWAEGVVDNENMGKKSSKKCCIFHKQRRVGEWDFDSDDSDIECCEECGDERKNLPQEQQAE